MQSLYIAGAGSGSGKSVVVLGFMEMLSAVNRKVGFFRPIVRKSVEQDDLTNLIRSRYNLTFPAEMLYGCTAEIAADLVACGRYDELLKRILGKFKALEEQCDLVVCSGTDFDGAVPSLEFDFNADLANNFGCLIVVVVKGYHRSFDETLDAVRMAHESLVVRGADLLATVVNRVPPEYLDLLHTRARAALPQTETVYVLPEQTALGMPTVGEVRKQLGAQCMCGEGDALNQVVTNYKIAAMEIPAFLNYIEDGCLIITPGDRSDIILASLIADVSTTYPRVAGLLLTGGLRPADNVQKLLEGLRRSKVSILSVPMDTFTTALAVNRVESTILAGDDRKIAAALGLFEHHVDLADLRERIAVRHSVRRTPLMFEYELIHRAKSRRQRIVLPEGTDERILKAAEILTLRGVAELTLLGDPDKIRRRIGELGLKLDDIAILDPRHDARREEFAAVYYELRRHKGISEQMAHDAMEDVSYFGTMMVHLRPGRRHGVRCSAHHPAHHSSVLRDRQDQAGRPSGLQRLLHVPARTRSGLRRLRREPQPQRRGAGGYRHYLGRDCRRLRHRAAHRHALLFHRGLRQGRGRGTRARGGAIARQLRPDLKLDGPIQYDAAIDATVGRSKMPESEVAGHATVFIFPDLNTGNNTYKAVQRSAGAVAIGPVLQGLNKPVNDLSRGCTVTDIVNTVAITAIQAQNGHREAEGGSR